MQFEPSKRRRFQQADQNAGTESDGSIKALASSDLGAIEAWLKGYGEAFNAKDLEKRPAPSWQGRRMLPAK